MRKQTKLVAVLSAAALLAIGASMTSFAAGWEKTESGAWQYVDKDGEIVENEWKKDGGKWFYLNDDGVMETNAWVDESYVGEDGHRLQNEWVKTYAEDEDEDDVDAEEHWFYFDNKGKKIAASDNDTKSKKILGKTYLFDENGKMLSGWQTIDDNIYYFGGEDDGARTNAQWLWLEKDEDHECDICEEEAWYYFNSKGQAIVNKTQKINGKKYTFNAHGQMLYEWINEAGATSAVLDESALTAATIGQMRYSEIEEDGSEVTGWRQIAGSESVGSQDDVKWYYFKNGEAKKAATGSLEIVKITWKVNGQSKSGKFCFNDKGEMQTGLRRIGDKTYYFDGDGYMKTGKITCDDANDETFNFYFNTKNTFFGEGYTGIKDNYLYVDGQRCEAEDKYAAYEYDGKYYLVNKNGKIQKNKKNIELDNEPNEKYNSDGNGVLTTAPTKPYVGGYGEKQGYDAKSK